jgi:hypothetical protein
MHTPKTTKHRFPINAREKWNDSGLILEAGHRYSFSIVSINDWKDWRISCGPNGYPSSNLLMCASERFRRVANEDWFALIGTIGKDLETHFKIGSGIKSYLAPYTGRLFCFANDVSCMYFNNRGSLEIEVSSLT